MTSGLLAGIRVLDFSQYLAGPACTRLMVEQGADCIKVELPEHGDPARGLEPRVNRRSGFFIQQGRGKRSVCVDFRTDDGRAVVEKLVTRTDVVVENFSPGVLGRYGLAYEDLRRLKPDVIMASISGFGQTGPLAHRQAFDFIAQGYSGLAHMTGFEDGPPLLVGSAVADTNAGVHAFAAIGHALFRRERSGEGAYIDISMVDALAHMHETGIHAPGMTGGAYVPMRHGRDYQPVAPAGVFKGPEGWLVVIVTVHQVDQLWDAMERPDLAADERFRGNVARVRNRRALNDLIEAWMATFETDDEVVEVLSRHRVPCTKVNSPAELVNEPHLVARGSVIQVNDAVTGPVDLPGHPLRVSGVEPLTDLPAERLGQSNHEVLASLGYTDADIADLTERRILFGKPHG